MTNTVVKIDGYNDELLTKNEAKFVNEVLKLYKDIPNMSSLLCLFYNNDLVEAGISTFASLVDFVFLIDEQRLTELCIFIARLKRSIATTDYYCRTCKLQVEANNKCCGSIIEFDKNDPDLTEFIDQFKNDSDFINSLKAKYTNWFSFPN